MIMCSSPGQQAVITESMKTGAMGFIVKPFMPDENDIYNEKDN